MAIDKNHPNLAAQADLNLDNKTVLPFKPRVVTSEVTPKITKATGNAEVIKLLESCLAAAKAGKLQFIAIATVDHEGAAMTAWEPEDLVSSQAVSQALGSVAFLNHRFCVSADAGGTWEEL